MRVCLLTEHGRAWATAHGGCIGCIIGAQNAAAEQRYRTSNGGDGLLAYIKSLDQENGERLTRSASDGVIEAMNTFVQRMIGATRAARA